MEVQAAAQGGPRAEAQGGPCRRGGRAGLAQPAGHGGWRHQQAFGDWKGALNSCRARRNACSTMHASFCYKRRLLYVLSLVTETKLYFLCYKIG